ncbi:MAG: sulfite exporter TauE/SafE family protein [Planctomycetes bacterium]|nr:sulfite exporter TauE/SafE family protein [Planctomycetota bacterium]
MDHSTILAAVVTVAAGVAMGAINNVAGGAGVLGLLAFEYAWHLPLDVANPSTRIAAIAIGGFACLGFLRAGRRMPGRAWLQGLMALPGAILGSHLALGLPPLWFRGYLAAVIALLLWQQLRGRNEPAARPRPAWLAALGCFVIGLHMGYVQVGTGLVATLVLAQAYDRDLLAVNAAKSILVIVTSIGSAASFAWVGAIDWAPALWLAAGAAVGSYLASHWSVAKGTAAVRRVVVVIAALTLAEQLRQIALLLWG